MPKADKNYRPNPDRCIYICCEFTEELAAKVLPEILTLRGKNTEPITVYINSRGGSVRILETIEGTLRSVDQDKHRCRLITVVLGEASSAAATLLTVGNYAVAYPHSIVHFHGVRRSEVDVTVEEATTLTSYLSGLNAKNAIKIARRTIDRIIRRYSQLLPEIESARKKYKQPKLQGELSRFIDRIKRRTSYAADEILDKTANRIAQAEKLTRDVVIPAKFKDTATGLQQDVAVFRALLNYELKQHKHSEFRLDDEAVSELVNDYFIVRDYHLGEHYKILGSLLRIHGPSLLEKKDLETYRSEIISLNEDERTSWLDHRIGKSVRMFWHFSVCLCRQLQSGENRLSASDAYWLGCVDEVVGTNMTGERVVAEADIAPQKAKSS